MAHTITVGGIEPLISFMVSTQTARNLPFGNSGRRTYRISISRKQLGHGFHRPVARRLIVGPQGAVRDFVDFLPSVGITGKSSYLRMTSAALSRNASRLTFDDLRDILIRNMHCPEFPQCEFFPVAVDTMDQVTGPVSPSMVITSIELESYRGDGRDDDAVIGLEFVPAGDESGAAQGASLGRGEYQHDQHLWHRASVSRDEACAGV